MELDFLNGMSQTMIVAKETELYIYISDIVIMGDYLH